MSLKSIAQRLGAGKKTPARSQADVVVDSQEFLQPLYFVMHPDNSFSVAEPQPRLAPVAGDAQSVQQLQFLLSQAPMLQAPENNIDAGRVAAQFAYLHPFTFNAMRVAPFIDPAHTTTFRYGQTVWVLTPLMPNGLVIYSPNKMPGLAPGVLK